jgi:hypothetical protein
VTCDGTFTGTVTGPREGGIPSVSRANLFKSIGEPLGADDGDMTLVWKALTAMSVANDGKDGGKAVRKLHM